MEMNYHLKTNLIQTFNLPWCPPGNLQLFNICNSTESDTMLHQPVAPTLLHALPLLEAPVDTLMPSSRQSHLHCMLQCVSITRYIKVDWVATVAPVCNSRLIALKHVHQIFQSNLQVAPLTTGERSIHPHNPSSLDTDTNLIPDTRAMKLLGIPLGRKRPWFLDTKVGTIHSNLAPAPIVVHKPVVPLDLLIACHHRQSIKSLGIFVAKDSFEFIDTSAEVVNVVTDATLLWFSRM